MNRRLIQRIMAVIFLLAAASNISAGTNIEDITNLPPGEQYRQLSLLLLISGGADPAMLEALAPQNAAARGRAVASFNPDDYKTPLLRIVDQESMLTGAAFLLRFVQESRPDIQARLAAIDSENPVLISMVDMNALTEDVIIIRNAIADSISYSSLAEDGVLAAHLQDYRIQTIRLRNIMEYELFDDELRHLTDEAIYSVSGKLDAYQRMFDEEVDTKKFDRQFDAAAYLYHQTEKSDEKAYKLTNEIMKNVILSQSQPNPDP